MNSQQQLKLINIVRDYLGEEKLHSKRVTPIVETFQAAQNATFSKGSNNSLMLVQIITNGDDSKLFHNNIQINETFEPDRGEWYLVNKLELKNTGAELKGQLIGYYFLLK